MILETLVRWRMDLLGVLESRLVQQPDFVRQCIGALERWIGDIVQ